MSTAPHDSLATNLARRLPGPVRDRLGRAYDLWRWRWDLIRRRGSPFVTSYLDGLEGLEIGAASHNCFYLDALNVDRYAGDDTVYKRLERSIARKPAPVDVVAPGDELPFADDSHDFVFSSHVIEHFPDPVKALLEWHRVARRYVVVIAPHHARTFDADRPLTTVAELTERHTSGFRSDEDRHWSVWTCESFLELCEALGLRVLDSQDPDDKVGNGFAVVIDAELRAELPLALAGPQSCWREIAGEDVRADD